MKPIYQLKVKEDNAELFIYGDIASDGYKWSDSDVSASDIVNKLQGVNAKSIDVYINSYGGEVAQGLAIYNALKRHKAKVTTYVDGFACSIASVIAMAGDVRKMYDNSLLMIHHAWTIAQGNAADLEKAAEDLKTISEASKKAYMEVVNITEAELDAMLDGETWITADKAVEMGFATEIVAAKKPEKASANALQLVYNLLTKAEGEPPAEPDGDPDDNELESVLADIVARLEKLEEKVLKDDGEGDPEGDPKKDPEQKTDFMENFFKVLQKEG